MGSSASKPASRAANAATKATRQYPSRPSPATSTQASPARTSNAPSQPPPPPAANRQPGPTVHPQARASGQRSEDACQQKSTLMHQIQTLLARSAPYNQTLPFRLHRLFAAHPSSHFPNSYGQQGGNNTTAPPQRLNPALRLAGEAEREFLEARKRGSAGRRFLDVGTLRNVITLRDQRNMSAAEIERTLGLRSGTVAKLGPKGVVGVEGIQDN
ncbi:unnamed protein product, partial [Aureobasidium mustum]